MAAITISQHKKKFKALNERDTDNKLSKNE